jgi:hypothetical protein
MDIKIVNDQGEIQEEVKPVEVKEPTERLTRPSDLDAINLAQMFDMDITEMRESDEKLKTLVAWAKTQVDEPTLQNIKIAIRNLESRVGSPGLAEKRITKIHRFAYLELQEQKLRKEKELLYGN